VHADRTSCMRLLAQSGGSCLLVQVNMIQKKNKRRRHQSYLVHPIGTK